MRQRPPPSRRLVGDPAADRAGDIEPAMETVSNQAVARLLNRASVADAGVRIETNATVEQLGGDPQTRAVTEGGTIMFRPGSFRPNTDDGRALIAHELVHVEQQRTGRARGRQANNGSPGGDPKHEEEASRAAALQRAGTLAADLTALKWDVRTQLDTMFASCDRLIDEERRWFFENWADYLGKTGLGDPGLSFGADAVKAVLGEAFGNAVSLGAIPLVEAGRGALRSAGQLVGAGGSGLAKFGALMRLGKLTGPWSFVVGTLIEAGVGLLIDLLGPSDKGPALAARKTADLITQAAALLDDRAARARSACAELRHEWNEQLEGMSSSSEVYGIALASLFHHVQTFVGTWRLNPDDRSLSNRLLHEWVLEHAGGAWEAGKFAEEGQWDLAMAEAFPARTGRWPGIERADLFAYQTRFHWSREIGLERGAELAERTLLQPVQAMVAEGATAKKVHERFQFMSYSWEFPDGVSADSRLGTFLQRRLPYVFASGNVLQERFVLECELDLDVTPGPTVSLLGIPEARPPDAVWVNEWEYMLRSPRLAPFGALEIDISPD